MSKPPLTLWLLNRCVDWPHSPLIEALSTKYYVRMGRRLKDGLGVIISPTEREVFVRCNAAEDSAPGELMHEGAHRPKDRPSSYDEYFMPMPLKCLGATADLTPFWSGVVSREGAIRLGEAHNHLQRRWGAAGTPPNRSSLGGFNSDRAETIIGQHFARVRMNLADLSVGYYEILQRATAQTGAQNVLVGYSQGGAVSRYLAFLDEHVSSKPCIHGIVTVQSPNSGSPVACAARKPDVSRALAGILLSVIGWLPPNFRQQPIWDLLRSADTVDAVNALLDSLLHSWPADHPAADVWLSARKWLSGLEGVPDLAFWDLDPNRLVETGSVLHAISHYPLERILHGAVVGTDGTLTDLVLSLLSHAPWPIRAAARWKRSAIEAHVREAEEIYRREALGLQEGDFHDFVIPSANQVLLPKTRASLDNVMHHSTHVSGAQGADIPLVCDLLRKM